VARELCIVGVNHRTAPVALRERLAFTDAGLHAALADLKNAQGISEAAVFAGQPIDQLKLGLGLAVERLDLVRQGVLDFLCRLSYPGEDCLSGIAAGLQNTVEFAARYDIEARRRSH